MSAHKALLIERENSNFLMLRTLLCISRYHNTCFWLKDMLSSLLGSAIRNFRLRNKGSLVKKGAKMAKRTKPSSEEKVRLARKRAFAKEKARLAIASLAEGINKTKFCTKHGIARSTLYAWQDVVLTRLSEDL